MDIVKEKYKLKRLKKSLIFCSVLQETCSNIVMSDDCQRYVCGQDAFGKLGIGQTITMRLVRLLPSGF